MSRNFRNSVMTQCTNCPPWRKQQDHGSFGDLTSINRRKTLKEDMPGKKSFSTLIQLNENGKSRYHLLMTSQCRRYIC